MAFARLLDYLLKGEPAEREHSQAAFAEASEGGTEASSQQLGKGAVLEAGPHPSQDFR